MIYKDLSQSGALQENWAKGLGPSSNDKDEDNMWKKSKEVPSTSTKPGKCMSLAWAHSLKIRLPKFRTWYVDFTYSRAVLIKKIVN